MTSSPSSAAAAAAAISPSLTVFVGTANLGNAAPDDASLSAWIPRDGLSSTILAASQLQSQQTQNDDDAHRFSIIALGFQEATFEGASDLGTSALRAQLRRHLPSYTHLVKYQRGEMRLEVFCHSDSCSAQVLHVAAQNTGLAGRPNKGGILAELLLHDNLRLSFTTCHLEAHEGSAKYKIRCSTMADIFHGTRPAGEMHDSSITSHYSFVLGDLNFRTELPQGEYADEDDHKRKVRDLVDAQQWNTLNQHDELKRALERKDCLVGFETLECHFPPTFKVERQHGYHYVDKRRPSYTDRILYKAGHDLDGRIRPLLYEPIENFTTSDHKPVRGVFEIQFNDKIISRPRLARFGRSFLISRRFSISSSSHLSPSSIRIGAIPVAASNKKDKLVLHVSNMKCQLNKNATFWKRLSKQSAQPEQTAQQQQHELEPINNGSPLCNGNSTSTALTGTVTEVPTSNGLLQGKSAVKLVHTLQNTVPSPYIMFVASPEDCIQRRQGPCWYELLRTIVCLGRRHHQSVVELDGTKTRTAMGWPRTSVRKHTRAADWGNETVKIQVNTHLPSGQAIPLTGSMLKMSIMDGEVIRSNQAFPLIGTFAFNLSSLLIKCMEANAPDLAKTSVMTDAPTDLHQPALATTDSTDEDGESLRPTMSNRRFSSQSFRNTHRTARQSVMGFLGLGTDLDVEVLEADIDEPLLRNGKEVGRIQCRIEAFWVDNEMTELADEPDRS